MQKLIVFYSMIIGALLIFKIIVWAIEVNN